MEYAINTLHMELYKQLEAIRVVNRYSAHPEYQGSSESFERNVSELHSAIERLQSSEQEESPATTGNIDYTAVLRVELSKLRSIGFFDHGTIDLIELTAHLNSAIKDSQNCV